MNYRYYCFRFLAVFVFVVPKANDVRAESNRHDPLEYTKAEVSTWIQLFRLYHATHATPATSLNEVVSYVREVNANADGQKHSKPLEDSNPIFKDGWGTPLRFEYRMTGKGGFVVSVISAGPNQVFGDGDDLKSNIAIDHPGGGS
jgi:hypothetical protein